MTSLADQQSWLREAFKGHKLCAKVEAILWSLAELEAARRDAHRWHETLLHIGADEDERGRQNYVIRGLDDSRVDLMRGSVAEHFTATIDARIPNPPIDADKQEEGK